MKIFLIDDDRLSQFLTQSMLVLEGLTHEIDSFCSAEEALEVLLSGGDEAIPDFMLLDLNMPLMDGWGFLDALALVQCPLKIRERCSIYILTSSLDHADKLKMKEYPQVLGIILKPIRSEDIKHIFS